MPIGVTDEHEELRRAVRRFVEAECPPAVPRALLDAGPGCEDLPPFWPALAAPGWLALHVSEAHGGAGCGLPEVAVVLEELGRAGAPGPYAASVLAAAVLEEAGGDAAAALLPALGAGETVGAVAWSGALTATEAPGGGLRVSGTLRPVLSGHLAGVLVVAAVDGHGAPRWCLLDAGSPGLTVTEVASVDLTRRCAEVRAEGVEVPPARVLAGIDRGRVEALAAAVLAAEAVGIAQWCVETAAEYAKVRVQFGRPIGQFQGVKHRVAEMLARTELARAAAWDAARGAHDTANGGDLAVAASAALAFDAAFACAKDCVQTLGGIGFTWEHDAHRYLRRALTLHHLAGAPAEWRVRAARAALGGARRRLAVDLPQEAEGLRAEVRAFLEEVRELDGQERNRRLADAGYVTPSWPRPWGRDASAIELLVIEEEFRDAKVPRPNIMVGAWALPPVILYGTPEQQARWIGPTLRGEITWCQLFSEPGAGSDLASLTTRATRVEGGWLLDGQKVWTSLAQHADWGICLARTDPDAPKHDGIGCFMVDMRTAGIDVRPLRELTGASMFNEVFLDGVFVPDDCLVGGARDGWRCARTTLANERVYMGSGNTVGSGVRGVLRLLQSAGRTDDALALDAAGELVVTSHALAVLGFRLTLQAIGGADPSGSEAAVRKLLGVQHDQHVQEVGLALCGPEAALDDGAAAEWSRAFLFNRCLTIAGGTSDVQRNVVAERLLGLPRDPEPAPGS